MKTNSVTGVHEILSLDQLDMLAQSLALQLYAGDILLLSGNLGAGKTTFTQFLGNALGVRGTITSPTYTLIGEYPVIGNQSITTLIHIDLYRIGGPGKNLPLNNIYIQEIIDTAVSNNAVVVIEWAEKMESLPSIRSWHISIELGSSRYSRRVTVYKVQ